MSVYAIDGTVTRSPRLLPSGDIVIRIGQHGRVNVKDVERLKETLRGARAQVAK